MRQVTNAYRRSSEALPVLLMARLLYTAPETKLRDLPCLGKYLMVF